MTLINWIIKRYNAWLKQLESNQPSDPLACCTSLNCKNNKGNG